MQPLRILLLSLLALCACTNPGCAALRGSSGQPISPEVYVSGLVAALDAGYLLASQQQALAIADGRVGACVASSAAVGLLPLGSELLISTLTEGPLSSIPAWSVDATLCGIERPAALPSLSSLQAGVTLAFSGLERQLSIWQPTLQADACPVYALLRTLLNVSSTLADRALAAVDSWDLRLSFDAINIAADCGA